MAPVASIILYRNFLPVKKLTTVLVLARGGTKTEADILPASVSFTFLGDPGSIRRLYVELL